MLLIIFQLAITGASASASVALVSLSSSEHDNDISNIKGISKVSFGTNTAFNEINNKSVEQDKSDKFEEKHILTRGEASYIIVKSLEVSLDSDIMIKATDLPVSHTYYHEIRKLVDLGILQNVNKLRPDEPLKRSEVAVMIARSFNVQVDKTNHKNFKDYNSLFWAKDYIESLADVKIINGTSNITFSPNEYVTQEQLVSLINRGLEFKEKVDHYEIAYDYLTKDYIPTKNAYANWSDEVVSLINLEREKAGVKPLTQDLKLNQLSIIKVQDMINRHYFEHESPYYGYPWDLATLFDYEYTSLGENIARNYHSPKDVVAAWMASPSHRENILRNTYTNIGVGVKEDSEGNYYWVQMFSSK